MKKKKAPSKQDIMKDRYSFYEQGEADKLFMHLVARFDFFFLKEKGIFLNK